MGRKINRASRTHGALTNDLTFVSMESRGRQIIVEKNLRKLMDDLSKMSKYLKQRFENLSQKRNIKSKWSYNYSNKLKLQFKIFHKGSTRLRKFYWWALQNTQGRKNSNLMQIILENKAK